MSVFEKLGSIESDPFAKYAVFADNPTVIDVCNQLGFRELPAHLHEALAAFVFYCSVYYAFGPLASVFTSWYPKLPPKLKNGAAAHVASWCNAILLLITSFPLFFSPKLVHVTDVTPYSSFVCALTIGYFMFDLYITGIWIKSAGVPFFLHALTALFVFLQGTRPYMHNFQPHFLWFELSTLFVNFYWFGVNVPNLVNETLQTVNGILLITAFFLCRVVPGPINGYRLFKESLTTENDVPTWVILTVMSCYLLLISLNNIWFVKMITAAYHKLTGKKPVSAGIESRFAKKVALDEGVKATETKAKPTRRRRV